MATSEPFRLFYHGCPELKEAITDKLQVSLRTLDGSGTFMSSKLHRTIANLASQPSFIPKTLPVTAHLDAPVVTWYPEKRRSNS